MDREPSYQTDYTLCYDGAHLLNRDAMQICFFNTANRLVSVDLSFTEPVHHPIAMPDGFESLLADYDDMDAAITQAMGQPTLARYYDWQVDTLRNTPEKYGTAFMQANLALRTEWTLGTLHVRHLLYYDHDQVFSDLLYSVR